MEDTTGLLSLGIIIAAGVIAAFITAKAKLPSILGYLIAGIILSLVLPLDMLHSEWLGNLAQLGAALLLFAIGVEFSIDNLKKVRNLVLIGAILQAVITVVAGIIFLPMLFQLSQYQAFVVSALVSTSSTAFVVKMLEMRGEMFSQAGNIMVGWLVVQDLMIVAWFLLFQTFAPNATESQDLLLVVIKTALVIGVVLLVGKYVLPRVMHEVVKLKSDELLVVTTVGVIAGFAVFANSLGISFTIGAFLAGLSLSESLLNHEIFTEVKPLRNLFMMVFFVSIGTLFNVNVIFESIGLLLFILIVILTIKVVSIVVICVWFDIHVKTALKVGLGIFQVGEFAFLGAQIGLQSQWIDTKLYSLLVAVTVLSMALTPVIYANFNTLYKFIQSRVKLISPNLYRGLFMKPLPSEFPATDKLSDHVIICGNGRVGKYVSEALNHSQIPFVVVEINAELAEELANQGINVVYGDSSNPDILQAAHIQTARAIVVALPSNQEMKTITTLARELNPKIKIIARSHDTTQDLEHADTIVEPEFEAAVQIISNLYKLIHRRQKRAIETVRLIRRNDLG